MEDKIKTAYYNPETGLISATKLYQKVKKQGVTMQQIKDFMRKQETAQLLKPVSKQKYYFPITSYEPY